MPDNRLARARRIVGTKLIGAVVNYILYDSFTTARSAGAVNGTLAEPTGQTRTVVDTNSKLSITGGQASFATGGVGSGDPGLWYPLQARTVGRVLLVNIINIVGDIGSGFHTAQSGVPNDAIRSVIDVVRVNGAANIVVASMSGLTTFAAAYIMRSSGMWFFIKGGTFTQWTLLWISTAGNSNMYPFVGCVSGATNSANADNVRVPATLYIPLPLAYDTFTRANGALGSTETTSPDGVAIAALAWNSNIGTWAITSNKAGASALTGGLAIATISVPSKDNFIEAALTQSAGIVGVVGRYTNASNYIYAYHDGTNTGVKQRLAAVETDLIAATAATFVASAVLRMEVDGNSCILFYNNVRVGGVGAVNAGLSGAVVGMYTTDTGNTLDLVTCWARGTSGEYEGALNPL